MVKPIQKQPRPQARFGMTFRQDQTQGTAGDIKNPISPNNCVVCSVKNLLSDYGYDETKINELIHQHLLAEYHAREQLKRKNPTSYTHEDIGMRDGDRHRQNEYNLNTLTLLEILHEGLGMKIGSYGLPEGKAKIEEAISERKRILVFQQPEDRYTLAGFEIGEGHAYLVCPSKNDSGWIIQDSWNGEQPLSTEELLKNLDLMRSPHTAYHVIEKPPNPEIINGILDAGPIEAGASAQSSTAPQQSASLRQEPAAVSPSVSKPAQSAPEKTVGTPNASGGFQKFRQWLKTRWNAVKQFWQNLTQRIKNWFSGKKSA